MSVVRSGLAEGKGKGREVRLAPNQYFHRKGGHFVHLRNSSKGAVATLCASGINLIFGWAETPKQADGYDAWKGSSTVAADKLFCIYADPSNVFELPANEAAASMTASWIGKGAALMLTGATYTTVQKARTGGGSMTASPVFVVDINKTDHTVLVKVKQTKRQAN